MSEQGWFPPPGADNRTQAATRPPLWAPPPGVDLGRPVAVPGLGGAVHRPGVVALRPLTMGDMYDAAFRIIRFNPRPTVGVAILVTAFAMLVPVAVTAVSTWTSADGTGATGSLGPVEGVGAWALGAFLQALGLLLVTGVVAHVTLAATLGRRLTLGEAWAATRGRRWRLVALTVLLALLLTAAVAAYVMLWLGLTEGANSTGNIVFGLLTVPLFLLAVSWLAVRLAYLPVPALVLEERGVLGALERGFRLSRRQFWRLLGTAVVTVLIGFVAVVALTVPLSILGNVLVAAFGSPRYEPLATVATDALGRVVSAAFVGPFTATVVCLQYLDQRIRKEAFDVELMSRAGAPRP